MHRIQNDNKYDVFCGCYWAKFGFSIIHLSNANKTFGKYSIFESVLRRLNSVRE